MSWRTVVISSSAKLDYQMGYMIVRRTDTLKIHLSEVEILHDRINSSISDSSTFK